MVLFPVEATDFSLLQIVQTGSGPHPDFLSGVPGALYPGIKRPESEADQFSSTA
jgi:hypothetical protein